MEIKINQLQLYYYPFFEQNTLLSKFNRKVGIKFIVNSDEFRIVVRRFYCFYVLYFNRDAPIDEIKKIVDYYLHTSFLWLRNGLYCECCCASNRELLLYCKCCARKFCSYCYLKKNIKFTGVICCPFGCEYLESNTQNFIITLVFILFLREPIFSTE